MTGFGRAEGRHGRLHWNWEAKSVNGRSLDVRVRVPNGYDRLEIPAKKSVAEIFGRGSVSLMLTVEVEREESTLKINRQLVEQVLALQEELDGRGRGGAPRRGAQLRGDAGGFPLREARRCCCARKYF